jgi:lipoprotein signal peptidase
MRVLYKHTQGYFIGIGIHTIFWMSAHPTPIIFIKKSHIPQSNAINAVNSIIILHYAHNKGVFFGAQKTNMQ